MINEIFFIPIYDPRNKGDLAILRSEIDFFKKHFGTKKIYVPCLKKSELIKIMNDVEVLDSFIDTNFDKSKIFFIKMLQFVYYFGRSIFQMLIFIYSIFAIKFKFPLIYRKKTYLNLKKLNLVINSGGSTITFGSKFYKINFFKKFAWYYTLISRLIVITLIKKVLKKKIVLFPQTIGPFTSPLSKVLAIKIISNFDLVFIREEISMEIANELKLKNKIILCYDIAFLLNDTDEKLDVFSTKNSVAICPRYVMGVDAENYERFHMEIIKYLVESNFQVFLAPSNITKEYNYDDDLMCSKNIHNRLSKEYQKSVTIINFEKSEEYQRLLGRMNFVISTRMHPGILALSKGTPVINIIYEHKQNGLLLKLDMLDYSMDINNLDMEKMKECISNIQKLKKEEILYKVQNLKHEIRTTILTNIFPLVEC